MYDTLMQMGRWFGYRPRYLDLCRLYTTSDLVEWFGHIADAAEELRQEFDTMAKVHATPENYGMKVQSHPVLMVTSPIKMRSAKTLQVSFCGAVLETVAFHRDISIIEKNLGVMESCSTLPVYRPRAVASFRANEVRVVRSGKASSGRAFLQSM